MYQSYNLNLRAKYQNQKEYMMNSDMFCKRADLSWAKIHQLKHSVKILMSFFDNYTKQS